MTESRPIGARTGAALMRRAQSCAALTRWMAIFLILNAFVLNGVLWFVTPDRDAGVPDTSLRETVLWHTWEVLNGRGSDDSWGIIWAAHDYARTPHQTPLYTEIFFYRQIKFQYPPTALFAVAAMRLIDPGRIRISDDYMGPRPSLDDIAAIAFMVMLALAAAAVLELRLRQTQAFTHSDGSLVAVRAVLVIAFTLTFYPAVKAFTLGQIQVWINGLFALALLCWIAGRKAAGGVLIGLICLIKPHYAVFLLWAAFRREWRFVLACAATGAIGLAASVAAYGVADHVDYLRALSFMSQHGEAYYPNQSVNGLLNRLAGLAEPQLYNNLEFQIGGFPPFNPWVYGGTMVAAAVILLTAIFHRRSDRVIDFCTMAVSATIASPIAWEHHYGVLLPIFAVLLAGPSTRGARLFWLVLSYVLASTFIPHPNLLAATAWNVLQSYLFAAAIIVLLLLHTAPELAPVR